MLNVFVFLSLLSTVICLCLGSIVFSFNRKSILNKLFFLSALTAFLYTFSTVMMWLSPNFATAYFWNKIEETWPFFVAATFNFVLVFTQSKWLKSKLGYLILYLPAATFFLINVSTNLIDGAPVLQNWGYADVATGTWIYNVSTVWSALLPILALALSLKFYLKTADSTQREGRGLVCIGFGIPCFTFIATNMLAPAIGISIPDLGIIGLLFFSAFVGYAILKVDLFTFDAALAAENILLVMPDSLLLADNNLKILRINQHLENFFGYTEKDLIGKPISKLCLNEGGQVCGGLLGELRAKGIIKNRELTVITSSGDKKCVLLSGSTVKSKKGKAVGSTCIFHDITERKTMEERLVKAERLASIGELAGQIGHDLRNPLQGIKNGVYILNKKIDGPGEERVKEILAAMKNAVGDADRIVTSLVDYSSELFLHREKCKVKMLVENALSKAAVPDYISVQNDATDETDVFVDFTLMVDVLTRIIKNAAEAIPDKGTIRMSSEIKGENLEISIIDSGKGITGAIFLNFSLLS